MLAVCVRKHVMQRERPSIRREGPQRGTNIPAETLSRRFDPFVVNCAITAWRRRRMLTMLTRVGRMLAQPRNTVLATVFSPAAVLGNMLEPQQKDAPT